jgi:UrcA family protein
MKAANFVHRSLLASLALGSALLAGTALAAGPATDGNSDARSMTVRYADVNLTTVAGATALYRRIEGAARLVCGESGRSLVEQHAATVCYQNAVAAAVATVNNPTLTAIHQGREGQLTAMLGR